MKFIRKNSLSITGGKSKDYRLLRFTLFAALTLTVMTNLAAAPPGDPWKDKDYKTWTNEDVQKILYESPWVKMPEMAAPWLKGPMHFLTPLPSDCNGRPDMNKGKQPDSWATGAIESIVIFQVTWQSARTVRAAKFRESVLCGRVDADRGDDLLEQEQENYVIIVNSPDMTPYDSMEEEALLKSTSLTFKKSQKKVNPESVRIGRYGSGKTVHNLTFTFPRKTDKGDPFFEPDEKEIEFVCQAGKFTLKAKFQPAKMTSKNGPDL